MPTIDVDRNTKWRYAEGVAYEEAAAAGRVNERSLVSTVDDPVKYRFGSPGGNLGALSINVVTPSSDPGEPDHHHEVGMLLGAEDERYGPGSGSGEWKLFAKAPGPTDDHLMVRVATIRHDGVQFHVPVNVAASGGGAARGRIYHEGENVGVSIYQNDLNVVTYDMHGTTDESQWTPVFSTHDLLARIAALEARLQAAGL